MHIVSDRGMDLAPEQLAGLEIHLVPLNLTLNGKTYRSGIDIQPDEFYRLLAATDQFPTTSQPSAGDFAELYQKLAATDRDILSLHISSGLSGTINSARAGAQLVPQANITVVDTKTLSGAEGWQVAAAARAAKAGWPLDQIVHLVQHISTVTDTIFVVATLRYLIHGGRISHLKGLLGSILSLKPIIGVEKETGKYEQRGRARTMKDAYAQMVEVVSHKYPPGSALRLQIMHGHNLEGAEQLHDLLDRRFQCTWLPTGSIAPVLGAHTGPGLVGLVYAPEEAFAEVP